MALSHHSQVERHGCRELSMVPTRVSRLRRSRWCRRVSLYSNGALFSDLGGSREDSRGQHFVCSTGRSQAAAGCAYYCDTGRRGTDESAAGSRRRHYAVRSTKRITVRAILREQR